MLSGSQHQGYSFLKFLILLFHDEALVLAQIELLEQLVLLQGSRADHAGFFGNVVEDLDRGRSTWKKYSLSILFPSSYFSWFFFFSLTLLGASLAIFKNHCWFLAILRTYFIN